MIKRKIRPWFGKLKWKEAECPFYFGTVFCDIDAKQHEIETELLNSVKTIIPKSFPTPDVIELYPGEIILHFEEEMEEAA